MSITYEEALDKAMRFKPSIDTCEEFDNAYRFSYEYEQQVYGVFSPIFILKDNGRAVGYTIYYDRYAGHAVGNKFKV